MAQDDKQTYISGENHAWLAELSETMDFEGKKLGITFHANRLLNLFRTGRITVPPFNQPPQEEREEAERGT